MYGIVAPRSDGVIHVTSVSDATDGLVTMNINDRTPTCAYDRFSLNASRAWSDIVVTSGRILREEPTLSHELQGSAEEIRALHEWRQVVAGRGDSATLILTSGQNLDSAHPIFVSSRRVIVFTASDAAARLTRVLRHVNAVVIGHDRPSPRSAVEYLRSEARFRAISIELGPSSSVALYDRPAVVDELWLSIYSGTVPPSVRGRPFLDIPRIRRILPRKSDRFVPGGAGSWAFYRFRRD
jgi:riboflavin biosynthesis pyrimidine reductase